MATYTFETVYGTPAGGKIHATVPVTAPTEAIAWEQLGEKVRDDATLNKAFREKRFILLGTSVSPDITEEQRSIARRILDKSADRAIVMGRYRGESVAIIVEKKDLGDEIAMRPVAIILTDDMLEHVEDFRGIAPADHGNEWEK